MDVQIRRIHDDEIDALTEIDGVIFGYQPTAEMKAGLRDVLEPERTWVAVDGGSLVGSAAIFSLEVTVPGGAVLPLAGVTWVGVLGTHRRRGILRHLFAELDVDIRERGEPAAGLSASESLIYRRFGYGPADRMAQVQIDTRHARFRDAHGAPERLEIADRTAAEAVMPELHDRVRRTRNGMVSLPVALMRVRHREPEGGNDSPLRFLLHRDRAGEVDGLAGYRVKLDDDDANLVHGEVRIHELFAVDTEAETAIWRFFLDHDLVQRVMGTLRPVDEAVADRLLDPRRWRQTIADGLHLRPFDIATLLAARHYAREDGLVLEVAGEGRYRLEGGLEGATCATTTQKAELVLDRPTLGSAYLGDAPLERLWRAGLVEERVSGAVARASAMFSWSPLPWSGYHF